jgi:hypothetical protein
VAADLEFLKAIFGDKRVHITLATVTKIEVVPSMSLARVQCLTLPEELEIIATVGIPSCSQGAFLGGLPKAKDLGVIAYSDMEEAYWVTHLSSSDDLIPQRAVDGAVLLQASSGEDAYVTGDSVFIGKSRLVDPTEPLVLGNVLKSALTDILADLKSFVGQLKTFVDAIKTGPIGTDSLGGVAVTSPAVIAAATAFETQIDTYSAQLDTRKSTYVTVAGSNIVSGVAFTERGS